MRELEDKALLAQCAGIPSSTWADALDASGLPGVVQGLVQRSGSGRIAGFAATARHVSGRLGDFEPADFAVGRLVAATGPQTVLMVDASGAPISTFGGIASLAAVGRNALAVVIDGACRDVDEIQAAGLWMASRHVTPLTGKRRLKLTEMGGVVTIGGIQVAQGDLVVADDTGIVVVPRSRVDEVLSLARAALAVDERVEQSVRDGVSFAEAAAAAGYIPAKGQDHAG